MINKLKVNLPRSFDMKDLSFYENILRHANYSQLGMWKVLDITRKVHRNSIREVYHSIGKFFSTPFAAHFKLCIKLCVSSKSQGRKKRESIFHS